MNKKIIAIGIVLLTAASFTFIRHKNTSNITFDEEQNLCTSAPPEYRPQCEQLNAWLNQRLVEWKPTSYKPMNFGAYHVYASDNMFVKSNADFDTKMLDTIEDVDPDTIVLYIRPGVYFSQKERYDALISKIRNDGKKLFIGARFDDKPMGFDGYGSALEAYTRNIIATIKPDYFGIVIEPMTMEQKYGFDATDEEWAVLVDRIAKLSKQLSPATKTAAGGHKGELNFLRLASSLASVDIIGFDIYDTNGIYPEYSGYLGKGDVVGNAIDLANSKKKETWILETWTSAMVTSAQKSICVQEFMKPIDAKWLQAMAYYAQKHNMAAIVPFYTGKFVYYGTDPKELQAAINNGKRTPAFYAYKEAISEIKKSTSK